MAFEKVGASADWRKPGPLVRFGEIIAALRRGGYTGIIGVEPFVCEPDGPTCAARAVGYLRGVMEAAA